MIVLDTHVWIWWVDDNPRLKRSVRDQIDSEPEIHISTISLLEIATAASLGRLSLKPSVLAWLEIAQSAAPIRLDHITDALCVESAFLPGEFHRDPADRLIVALARKLAAPLVTADRRILAYSEVLTIAAE